MRVEFLRTLRDEERAYVADRLKYAPFAPGETITKQGAVAHWLYIIVAGIAEVRVNIDGTDQGRRQDPGARLLRRDGADDRRAAHRHRGRADRRRVLPPRQGGIQPDHRRPPRDRAGDRARPRHPQGGACRPCATISTPTPSSAPSTPSTGAWWGRSSASSASTTRRRRARHPSAESRRTAASGSCGGL